MGSNDIKIDIDQLNAAAEVRRLQENGELITLDDSRITPTACGHCGEKLVCWCGEDVDHASDDTHSPSVMGCPNLCEQQ